MAAAAAGLTASASAATKLPDSGFVVFKESRNGGVIEVRDAATGRVVAAEAKGGDGGAGKPACDDRHHHYFGPRWKAFEPYLVNSASIPSYLDGAAARADVVAAHDAWQSPFVTDCPTVSETTAYDATDGGDTGAGGSLADGLTTDGLNVVAFESLAGTICDGALACTVISYKGGTIDEADLLFEQDLTRYGFQDFWTTDDTTWVGPTEARYALADVATHEWGHFAGLDHVEKSPELTMFPFIRDGMQTLGLGDMRGIAGRY